MISNIRQKKFSLDSTITDTHPTPPDTNIECVIFSVSLGAEREKNVCCFVEILRLKTPNINVNIVLRVSVV